jgi:hypothetical protein
MQQLRDYEQRLTGKSTLTEEESGPSMQRKRADIRKLFQQKKPNPLGRLGSGLSASGSVSDLSASLNTNSRFVCVFPVPHTNAPPHISLNISVFI